MRMLMKVQIPTEAGNRTIKDGTLPDIIRKTLETAHAEAAYFTAMDGRTFRKVSRRFLIDIIEPRVEEIFTMVSEKLQDSGYSDRVVPGGVILTGGGSQLRGLVELSERVFNLPVRIGIPRGLGQMSEDVSRPEYSAAVGLVLYGARTKRFAGARPTGFMGKLKSMFAGA